METINVLLGCSERRINNHIEIALRDVCYGEALVNCQFIHRLDSWITEASAQHFHLLILAPEHVIRGIGGKIEKVACQEAAEAIRNLRQLRATPVLAFTAREKSERLLLEAGVERVFPTIFNEGVLRDELRRVLNLSPADLPSSTRVETCTLATLLIRSLQRFRPA
jgi:hypothetical protein